MMSKERPVRTVFQLSQTLAHQLAQVAEEESVTKTDVVRRALSEHFARRSRPPKEQGRRRRRFQDVLRQLRGDRTQTDIATVVGVNKSMVCRWESGHSLPTRRKLLALAKALGCNLGTLESSWRR